MARTTTAADALETLVQQFSQPLAFLRELIQNSLDAGTNRIDVSVGAAEDKGLILVEVADTGEGMTREVIDTQLTRLFSSTKEDDFTKIGKFGIGFVSVFAVKPEVVVVDTGREGESWRVLFRTDRSFERIRREEPVDGTRVGVYLKRKGRPLKRFITDCRDTLVYWCKHCDVEVRFNGEPINQPFQLDSPCQVRHTTGGTEVVVAPSTAKNPLYGFYNRGLTLLEGQGSPVEGVSFKMRSGYLEHTLTRDNVLQDQNYHKAMAVLREAAYHELPEVLFQMLALKSDPELWTLARVVAEFPGFAGSKAWTIPVVPGVQDKKYSLQELSRGPAPVWAAGEAMLQSATLMEGIPVLAGQSGPLALLKQLELAPDALPEAYYLVLEVEPTPEEARLLDETSRLLRTVGFPRLQLSSLEESGPKFSARLAVFFHDFGRAQEASRASAYARGRRLGVGAAHPLWQDLRAVSKHDPGLAAYILARAVCLECEADPRADAGMLTCAVKRRRANPATTAVGREQE